MVYRAADGNCSGDRRPTLIGPHVVGGNTLRARVGCGCSAGNTGIEVVTHGWERLINVLIRVHMCFPAADVSHREQRVYRERVLHAKAPIVGCGDLVCRIKGDYGYR